MVKSNMRGDFLQSTGNYSVVLVSQTTIDPSRVLHLDSFGFRVLFCFVFSVSVQDGIVAL